MPIIVPDYPSTSTTLLDIRTDIQARGYETDTLTAQNSAINTAYRRLCGEHHWTWLETDNDPTLSVGTSELALSTAAPDSIHVISVRLMDQNTDEPINLDYVEAQEWLTRQSTEFPGTGAPTIWTVLRGVLMFLPAANRDYDLQVVYIFDPGDLVDDDDELVIPNTYRDTVTFGALAEMAARERDWAQHDRWMTKYAEERDRMRAQLGIRQQQTATQVIRTGRYDDYKRVF